MPTARLTKRIVDALEPGERPVTYYDRDLIGFGVRVMPSGYKSWIVEYRPGDGGRAVAKKRLALGRTNIITAEQARRKARDILSAAHLGADPAAERTKNREMPTFRIFTDRYLREEADLKLRPRTVELYGQYFRKHAIPRIGSLKLNAVTKAHVARLHREIGKRTPATANRVVKAISSLYRYAAIAGEVEDGYNPTRGIQFFREQSRERFLSKEELQRLGATLRLAETDGLPWEADETKPNAKHLPKPENRRIVFSPYATAAIRLLLFTGCRLREILHLKWEDIDFERGMFVLPESKTGKRYVILNAPALAVLTELERASTYVIAGDTPGQPRADLKKPWSRITRHAKLEGVRLHDLRHSFASVGAAGGMGLPIVGKLLGHTQAQTTARYAHLDNDPLKHASQQIAGAIAAALDGA